ncbi:MAG TPA: tRNA glutamyl-Q(34) synthetase GluQRS [Polyangiaceae bacterium]|nr:tRNA glutamyl-Q(34) synthetase GluQRS [Polyangiaceae bacterium]
MSVAPAASVGVTGRLAPSPTGLLHLGHARTFLGAWWSARAQGGRVLLRLEDLDGPRASARFGDDALRDLEWLGLDWDGVPSVQSEHLERFTAAVARLLAEGKAYPCVCTRGDLRTAQNAPHAGDKEPRYPGTCRGRFATLGEAERASGRAAGVRLRVPEGPLTLEDAVFGSVSFDVAAEVGDFLIARRGGAPAYQLAVVVDDADGGVTEVVRGADLLPSAARQWHVQAALELPHPRYAHLGLVTDERGARLAKHADALSLAELRNRGADPRRIVTWAARTLGIPSEGRASAREIIPHFRLTERAAREEPANTALVAAFTAAPS